MIPTSWELGRALVDHPGLTVLPCAGEEIRLTGELRVNHSGPPHGLHIEASYQIDFRVPLEFPRALPLVYETEGKIPSDFHRLNGGALCLGSPAGQRIQLGRAPSIGHFIDRVVIPYLYGHAHMVRVGKMPFDELAHGVAGLVDDARCIFGLPGAIPPCRGLELAAMRRRVANKRPCPCGSGRRLGRCHNRSINHARALMGRAVCLEHASLIVQQRKLEGTSSGSPYSPRREARQSLAGLHRAG
jgi:hypothetical protein